MKFVYVAGPYTRGDVVINVREAIKAAEILRNHGFIPFVPHLTHFWHLLFPHKIDYWYDYDNAWLKKCDVLLRLSGDSAGADAEVGLAKELGLPVYYSLVNLIDSCSTGS